LIPKAQLVISGFPSWFLRRGLVVFWYFHSSTPQTVMPKQVLNLILFQILTLSVFAQGDQLQKVDSIVNHGQELINISSELAIDRLDYALAIANENNWKEQAAIANKYLGISHFYLGAYDVAQAHYLKSLQLYENLDDQKGVAQVCNELGVFYSRQEDYETCYKYYQRAQKIASENDYLPELAISLSNQGMTHFKLGRHDEAFPLMSEALAVKEQLNDSIGMGYELKRLATYYFVKEQYNTGLEYLNKSSAIREALGDKSGLAINEVTIAEMYHMRKMYDEAISYFKTTLKLADEIGYADLARYALEMLHDCYATTGNYEQAYRFQADARQLADSLFNDRKTKTIAELQTKYETAEKEQEIANQQLELSEKESEIQSKKIQIGGLIGGLIILLLFGFIFYNQYRAKQNQKLQSAILAEKERGFESVIQATEEERKRISKDLHDGIGQQLSALKMALSNMASNTSDEDQQEDLEIIIDQFSKSAEEVRQVSHQMMPRTLMDYGLVNAIEDLLQNSFKFSDIKYDFEHRLIVERFDERIEISLYRVLQELINNIIKHSQASEISVQLIQNKGKLLLFVEDNGKGMNNDASDGHGLLNIKSRLDMVKGTVNYEPSPSSGTSATISIPV